MTVQLLRKTSPEKVNGQISLSTFQLTWELMIMIELIILTAIMAAELVLAFVLAIDEISYRKSLHKKSTKKEKENEQG